jgi:hypothetical protein
MPQASSIRSGAKPDVAFRSGFSSQSLFLQNLPQHVDQRGLGRLAHLRLYHAQAVSRRCLKHTHRLALFSR